MPFQPTAINSFLFLGIFILAFFPNLFNYLLLLPLVPLKAIFSSPPPTLPTPAPEACHCCSPITDTTATMSWFQKQFTLSSRSRGSYLVTDEVTRQLPEIAQYKVGLLNLFVQHTSCALSLNENWDEEVREDMSDALDRIAPEDKKGNLYRHSAEGLDDMPAHIKSALIGASVTVPIRDGKLATGTWQGIWYLEFRAAKHSRKVVATIQGEKK
ncbi:UPF0047-domain-containing protein [Myriangium duriaei CBS 260.36]|uniref:UPF0047-domain-containing protein n=1 Tax=Myriangium duriaei CBS 260.36 TaxID=1168546 RepID=A0A9P4J2X9_9PEZI|nr:UPF0047-domain-containing protein [Myriangium duriaei CBS 260.36]